MGFSQMRGSVLASLYKTPVCREKIIDGRLLVLKAAAPFALISSDGEIQQLSLFTHSSNATGQRELRSWDFARPVCCTLGSCTPRGLAQGPPLMKAPSLFLLVPFPGPTQPRSRGPSPCFLMSVLQYLGGLLVCLLPARALSVVSVTVFLNKQKTNPILLKRLHSTGRVRLVPTDPLPESTAPRPGPLAAPFPSFPAPQDGCRGPRAPQKFPPSQPFPQNPLRPDQGEDELGGETGPPRPAGLPCPRSSGPATATSPRSRTASS